MMKRVLVTGGTGFLGQKLATRLQDNGHLVTVIGRNEIAGRYLTDRGIAFVQADITDREAIRHACKGQEIVFHAAAFSSPWGKYTDMYATNVEGTIHTIEGCKAHGVERLVHVSTPSIYFDFEDRLDIKESAPLPRRFANSYAQTKYLAELEIEKAFQGGLATITIRPRGLFGPGDNAVLPRLIRANEEKFVPLVNGGKATIDLTYVENVVDALLLCMDSPTRTLGRAFNITNGEPVTMIDVLREVFQRLGMPLRAKQISYREAYAAAWMLELASKTVLGYREPVLTRYSVGVLAKSQTLDISRAKDELGYQPRVSMQEGIELFTKWWRTQHER
ncbi:NAD-dependent epimerase/dehydratase family protein [Brevibacillus centrosporus]|uniref:NAD-dependent epimerase/dehydratase family protein n=1 Tax=Brevibacillus centrosporus TaxID=54910 RepID=UPI000F0A2743|nr:NAD-dependent epimerase/dehydratase family protein [Brevibacillus centrosporus]MEC2129144.1 NAD-dependent epimerase/dehydratase family protein [Brevibacillus centrosporus]RNB70500.1 NAD-dependent epimerase/dehydratase family protein [Brevibacillus centrosporus]GED29375.1 3-beta hydroxysteroid dehydrogenase [Brevibacillus centrosporus]